MNKSEAFKYVKWARDDYICLPWEYDCWLLNKYWCVRPSIAFYDRIPFVLSCREYDKGNKQMMIHPPLQPSGNLSSKLFRSTLSSLFKKQKTIFNRLSNA